MFGHGKGTKMPPVSTGHDNNGNNRRVTIDESGKAWERIGSGSHTILLGRAKNGEQAVNLSLAQRALGKRGR